MNSLWTEHPDPPRSRPARKRWLIQAVQLGLLRRPRDPLAPGTPLQFAIAAALWLLSGVLLDDWLIDLPREFSPWAMTERSFPLLIALAGAALVASLLGRGRVALGLASIVLVALLPASLLWMWVQWELVTSNWMAWLPALYFALFAWQLVHWCAPRLRLPRRAAGMAAALAIMLGNWQLIPESPWWWNSEDEFAFDDAELAALDADAAAASRQGPSAEQLWLAQPARIEEALSQLAPQRPGVIDLYVLALAGDGSEQVFRNEVGFVRELAETRFGAAGRVLPLVNSADTLDQAPIASVGNLRAALHGMATLMDPEEDLLWLFLTSHGSEEHELFLGLDPLPLDWLDPTTLRQMLDEAGIGWRVIVVSACYSGGFVEALRDPRSLVITAARADRTSFGCGVQSEITWFGEAFLAEGLNQTFDFGEAFRMARSKVRERESEEGERPSYPQIALGQAIAPRLETWRATLPVAPTVTFAAGLPVTPEALIETR